MLKNKVLRTVGAATLALMVSISAPEAKITISGLKQDLGMTDADGNAQKYKAMEVVEKFEGLFKKAASQEDMGALANLYTHFICTGKMRVAKQEPSNAAQNFVPPTQKILVSQTKATDPQKIKIQSAFKAMFEGLKNHNVVFVHGDFMNSLATEFSSVQAHIHGAIALANEAHAEVFKAVVEEKKKADTTQITTGLRKMLEEKNKDTPSDSTGDKTTDLFAGGEETDGNPIPLATDEKTKQIETTPTNETTKPDISDVLINTKKPGSSLLSGVLRGVAGALPMGAFGVHV